MDVQRALQELAEDIKNEVLRRLRSPIGINPRTGTNTLVGSELEASIDAYPQGDNAIVFQIADYWEFLSRGWQRTGNYPNTFSKFVNNVNDWVRRKGIRFGNLTQNQITWAVVKSIWVRGIRPRPFLIYDDDGDFSKMLPELDNIMEEWFNSVFNALVKEIEEHFG